MKSSVPIIRDLDLKDTLTEYKVFGITYAVTDHTAVFEF